MGAEWHLISGVHKAAFRGERARGGRARDGTLGLVVSKSHLLEEDEPYGSRWVTGIELMMHAIKAPSPTRTDLAEVRCDSSRSSTPAQRVSSCTTQDVAGMLEYDDKAIHLMN